MPFGGLLTAGVSAGGSILSGLLGGKGAKAAAQKLSTAGTQVAGNINSATTNAQNLMGAAVPAAQQGVTNAAGTAASGVNGATSAANSTLGDTLSSELANLNPYLSLGSQGASNLSAALSPGGALSGTFAPPNPQDISSTPEYQFQLQQGLQALTRAAAATGGVQGGGTLKGITQYGQGLASTAYQQAYNNAANTYQMNRQNSLQSAMAAIGVGQGATGQFQSASQNAGNQQAANTLGAGLYAGNTGINAAQLAAQFGIGGAQYSGSIGLQGAQAAGQATMQGAGAQAAGIMGQTNAWNSALNGVTNAATGAIANYNYQPSYNVPAGQSMPGYNPGQGYSNFGSAANPWGPLGPPTWG